MAALCVSALALTEGCSQSGGVGECGGVGAGLPVCPAGATCNGACDLDGSVTSCGSIACTATCVPVYMYVEAGNGNVTTYVISDAPGQWVCAFP